jgi:hypothetical protein
VKRSGTAVACTLLFGKASTEPLPTAFPNGLSRDPGAKKPLRRYRTPSSAACPDRILPYYALLCAATADCGYG